MDEENDENDSEEVDEGKEYMMIEEIGRDLRESEMTELR